MGIDKQLIRVSFSDTFVPISDNYTTRTIEARVDTTSLDDSDARTSAEQEAKNKLTEFAREFALVEGRGEATLVNYQFDMRSGVATAEVYAQGASPFRKRPSGHGSSELFRI